MSTLTKVFVVLLVVFSIAFTSMTVSITTQTANWKGISQRFEEHARVADTNLRHLIAANSAELASASETINTHLDTIAKLTGKYEEAASQLEVLKTELRRVESEKSITDAMNRGLLAQLQSSETERLAYKNQRDDLEQQSVDLQRRNIDLNDRVNELTARTAVMLEQKRQFEQQINLLRAENERMVRELGAPSAGLAIEDAAGVALPQVTAITPVAAAAIRGKVVDVSGDIVTISVGASDGVEKEMLFVIHRGGQYVGDMKISLVDPNTAAGRIVSSRLVPAPGDQVTDARGLAGSRG